MEIHHSHLIQASKIEKLLDSEKAQKHADETKTILNDMGRVIRDRKLAWVMEMENYGEFNSKLKNYSLYEIVEMLITIGICITQVKLIKKMLNKDSII